MAISKKKVPSPSDVKKSPTPFSEQELKEIKDLRSSLNSITYQLGMISVERLKLDEKEKELKNEFKNLEKKEINLASKLSSKYGKGSIDIETGTFTPLQ
jgi:predicted nuclease with TOPRIM domain